MPSDGKAERSVDINSENIFDEFADAQDIKKELEENDKKNERDIYYYLKKISGFFLGINIVLFLLIIACSGYIYIQKGINKTEYSFIAPICSLFLGSDSISSGTCYGVTPILSEYTLKLKELREKQSSEILPLLGDTYSLENFNLSRKVSFLLEKSESRLKPLTILSEFDSMKNIFSPTDKSEISCYSITISGDTISMTCDSYSSDWNTDIVSVDGTTFNTVAGGGTSISKASSFIDFLDKYSFNRFEVIEKPDFYTSESFQSGPYTQKTTFQFSLLYTGESSFEIN